MGAVRRDGQLDNRRGGLTEEELKKIAVILAAELQANTECRLTEEQQRAVVDLITQKKRVVRVTLWFIGAVFLWAMKDVYLWFAEHISFGWGR